MFIVAFVLTVCSLQAEQKEPKTQNKKFKVA